MTITPKIEHLLEQAGWTVECESPLEVRHKGGSFAAGYAAELVIQAVIQEQQ